MKGGRFGGVAGLLVKGGRFGGEAGLLMKESRKEKRLFNEKAEEVKKHCIESRVPSPDMKRPLHNPHGAGAGMIEVRC